MVSDEAAVTIAAISVLRKHFTKDVKLWRLVEKKAKKFVYDNSADGLDKKAIEEAIHSIDNCYSPYV